ncbi:MAG: zf-HC2 domain-containing protein [Lachnospiraceae bacterium]|nr:zf-HC2 domain-containing protein [Lachnospiraceae bacterium]
MAKVSCSIIQDLLPLYCDNVCSADSRKMIEEHLQECAVCSGMFRQLGSGLQANTQEIVEDKGKKAVLEKMSRKWKRSLLKTALKALLIGIVSTTIVLMLIYGVYYTAFVEQRDMVAPEQVIVDVYRNPEMSEQQITIKMHLTDGYCGGTMDASVDEEGNMYISVLRTVVKEVLPDSGDEVMIYGFNQAQKDYKAVYYGSPDNCVLIWQPGDMIPDAAPDDFD